MNNIQQLRLNLEQLYELMGGAQLDDDTKTIDLMIYKNN